MSSGPPSGSASSRLTLGAIAEAAGGRVHGDPELPVVRVAPLDRAGGGELGLVADPEYLSGVSASRASALLVAEALESRVADMDDRPRVVVADPRAAMIPILRTLDPTPHPEPGVHPTAVVERGVKLGERVSVGPYTVLGEGAEIGAGTHIGAHCVIGAGARIGADGYLHPQVTVYGGSVIGDRVILHAGARIGSDGFGFAFEEGRYIRIPQVGRAVLGDDVEVGANSCVDRGSIGDTEIRDGVKIDNLVQVAHNVRVGEHSAFAALVGIAGSSSIGAYTRLGGMVGVVGHLDLPANLDVTAGSIVLQSVGEPGDTLMGYGAGPRREKAREMAATRRLPELLKRMREVERTLALLTDSGES